MYAIPMRKCLLIEILHRDYANNFVKPYVAGCIALMMQASEDRNSAVILDRLTNYAKPIEKETALMETPIKQGSGLVQVCGISYQISVLRS